MYNSQEVYHIFMLASYMSASIGYCTVLGPGGFEMSTKVISKSLVTVRTFKL